MEKTILITGANRSLGLELTCQYLTAGCRVVASCRNPGTTDGLLDLKHEYRDQLEVLKLEVASQEQLSHLEASLGGARLMGSTATPESQTPEHCSWKRWKPSNERRFLGGQAPALKRDYPAPIDFPLAAHLQYRDRPPVCFAFVPLKEQPAI